MPRYLIEREFAGAGKLTPAELAAISEKSCGVLSELGPAIQRVQSYVADDHIFCTYIAPNAEIVREHARRSGFPANRITAIRTLIDPVTAENHT